MLDGILLLLACVHQRKVDASGEWFRIETLEGRHECQTEIDRDLNARARLAA